MITGKAILPQGKLFCHKESYFDTKSVSKSMRGKKHAWQKAWGAYMVKKQVGNINVIIAENYDELSKLAADLIANQVQAKKDSTLGLATGSTPIGTYKELVQKGLDFASIKSFNLDEYFPIAKQSDQSYSYFMNENLFKLTNISADNCDIPSGEAADAQAECDRYEIAIKAAGGIDLQLLGLGLNGHIGFNEPDNHFPMKTHLTPLTQSTINANSRLFESADDVPKKAITMGLGTIMSAKSILMLISGEAKADIAKAVICGKVDPQVPGSILQMHNDVTAILDKAAAKHFL